MFFELKNSDVNELFKSRKGHSRPRAFVPMSNWWVWTNFEPNLGCVPGIKCKFYPPHDTIEKEIFDNKEYFIFPWVFHHWVRGFFKYFPYPLWTIISKRNVSVGKNIFFCMRRGQKISPVPGWKPLHRPWYVQTALLQCRLEIRIGSLRNPSFFERLIFILFIECINSRASQCNGTAWYY